MSAELLPSNAGPATVALAATWDTLGRYGGLIGTIKNYGITITPDDWVPWFIWDYGLEDVVPYVRDFRKVLAEGPAWQARRGTDAGIAIGIGWVESEGIVAPPDQRHNWWEFQVGFTTTPVDITQIAQLEGIINLSKASEDELFRMFSIGRDHRPVRMDKHRFDGGLMDGYSGEVIPGVGAKVSFGWIGNPETETANEVGYGAEIDATNTALVFGGMRLDRDRFGIRPRAIAEASDETDGTFALTDIKPAAWPSFYPTGSWAVGGDLTVIPTTVEVA
jgi:hypothetical protein